MAQGNRVCVGFDCQVGEIHACLTTAQNQDILALSKLLAVLELRRVHDGRYIAQAVNMGDVWQDVQAGANSNSVALPLRSLTILQVVNDMTTIFGALNFCDRSVEEDRR